MKEIYEHLSPYLPRDNARQATARSVAAEWCSRNTPGSIMDLGCGNGDTIDLFKQIAPSASWTGLDIEWSPEVGTRTRSDGEFYSYDGRHFPFEDERFDLVYTRQVFEHVRYPEEVLREVWRVLRPGGTLIGSTSHLEPYHSFSFWNYTVYGFSCLLADAGLTPEMFRPGIDGETLIARSKASDRTPFRHFFDVESPANEEIERKQREAGKSAKQINFQKLMYCGHFVFVAKKGVDAPAQNEPSAPAS